MPKTTVIVATYNSASRSHLRLCLDSIHKQQYPGEIEIVVVDGGSTDETIPLSKSYGATIIHNPAVTELGFSGGKNLAFHNTDGPLVAIVDADNVLIESDYLARMAAPIVEDASISMSIPAPYVPSGGQLPSVCRFFCCIETDYWSNIASAGNLRNGWIEICPPKAIVPNGCVFRRRALEAVGGWDYDTEVTTRLISHGLGKFAMVQTAHRLHIEMTSYLEVWRKLRRRIVNHMIERARKPIVQRDIEASIINPILYINEELVGPLTRFMQGTDPCYINVIPVFLIKSLLLLRHVVLYKGFVPSNTESYERKS